MRLANQSEVEQLERQVAGLATEREELHRLRMELERKSAEDNAKMRVLDNDNERIRAANEELKQRLADAESQLASFTANEARTEDKLISSLVLAKYASATELAQSAALALGYSVQYYGMPRPNQPGRPLEERTRFVPMERNNSIIVTDFPDRIDAALAFLEKLDVEMSTAQGSPGTLQADAVIVYEPVSLNSYQVQSVLSYSSIRFDPLPESNKLVLRGTEAELESAAQLLAATDRAVPQIQVRAWLVSNEAVWREVTQGSEEPLPPLPKDLSEGLGDLLPGEKFGALSSLTLRSSAQANDVLSACVRPGPVGIPQWRFDARIKGYQASTRTLQLDQCTTILVYNGGFQDTLAVNLALVEGEYAVVGSVQGGRMNLVLSFEAR